MKKQLIFFCLIVLSIVVSAQSAIYKPQDTYFYNHWRLDTCQSYAGYSQTTALQMEPVRYAHFKRSIVDEKSITVYGVAFCAIVDSCFCHSNRVHRSSGNVNNVAYPIADSAYLKVQMRRYDNGAMPLLAETVVYPLDSMPRYYLRDPSPAINYNPPIYEAFFPEGVTVCEDTIYVGYFIPRPEGPFRYFQGVMNLHTWPISSGCLFQLIHNPSEIDSSLIDDFLFMDTIGGEWRSNDLFPQWSGWFDMYLFPIIAPYSPSTPQPQEVSENRGEVHVLLSPNPASHLAGVSASAVIERLVVYNAAGVKVYESEPDYVIATLDVARWPSGVYLMEVHTTAGTVTKKLTVKR